ncbi:MAG: UDP-N-acetylglucosamine 2-epimerase (non-hydrolyzing) [Planctomycetota bacterium]|nr:UDP-N-acetylglucosamine 2-epimerase (non-hydrolyzing) [Planctomycetota bacterium]
MLRICVVFGTRPEGIKVAPVVAELAHRRVPHLVVATAQHRKLLDDVLRVLPMRVDYDLDIMKESQSPNDVASAVIEKLGTILKKEKPDMVLVQGDTTSTLASALASYYANIPIGHIEAGLRTYDLSRPYPEEGNRRMVSQIATLHFAPTNLAKENLLHERIPEEKIIVTGNTVIDALLSTASRLKNDGPLCHSIEKNCEWLKREGRMILVTVHRRESFGEPLRNIFTAFRQIVQKFDDVFIVYPVHPNPNVRTAANEILKNVKKIFLVEPLDYASFILNMMRSYLILTDSGGIQEEAPSLKKPVLVLRDLTERPEAVEAGCAKVIGTDTERIFSETQKLLNDSVEHSKMASGSNPFGDGKASERIINTIEKWFKDK